MEYPTIQILYIFRLSFFGDKVKSKLLSEYTLGLLYMVLYVASERPTSVAIEKTLLNRSLVETSW